MMALVMISAALLHFSYHDRMWHIYTPEDFLAQARDGAIMHARPEDGVRLLQVPLVPLGTQFPILRELAQAQQTTSLQTSQLGQAEQERCEQVVAELTARQLETLKAFAAGLSPQQVADQMNITLDTVNTHKKAIVDLCRNAWPEQERIRYHHLREWFGPYFGL
jgi:CRISPR-associated protein Csx14